MKKANSTLIDGVRVLADEMREVMDDHTTIEVLAAYHHRQLPAEEIEVIQDHLSLCHQCTQLLLDYAAFESAPEAREELSGRDLAGDWVALEARLDQQPREQIDSKAIPKQPSKAKRLFKSLPVAYGIAATLGLVILGQAFWIQKLNRPLVEITLASLVKVDELNRGGDRETLVNLDATCKKVVFSLNRIEPWESDDYKVSLLDASENTIWHAVKSGLGPKDSFAIEVPSAILRTGTYKIQLQGSDSNNLEIEEYRARIVRQ